MKTAQEISGTTLNTPIFALQKKRQKGPEKISEEVIAENFTNTGKEIVNQVQEAQRGPVRINPRKHIPRHTVIKVTKIKDKDKLLKATREKKTNNIQGNSHSIISYFLSKNSTNQKGMTQYTLSDEKEVPTTKNTQKNFHSGFDRKIKSHLYVFFGEMSDQFFGSRFGWFVYFSGIQQHELLVYFGN